MGRKLNLLNTLIFLTLSSFAVSYAGQEERLKEILEKEMSLKKNGGALQASDLDEKKTLIKKH